MAIRDLQSTLAEMGRIRLGQRVPKADGSGLRPAKLDVFKFTSAAEHLITEIAALYGGKVEPFTGDGVRGKQFMTLTETNDIPVYVPQQKIDPFYESWAGGVCTRRCDGERDHIHDNPCDCNPEKRACKPTTRVKVMLADVPGLGVWRLETHGIYAAMELSQLASFIERVPVPLPGRLILQSRMRKFFNREKGKVETRDYYVPVIDVSSVTFRQLAVGGDALSQALGSAAPAMLDAAPEARALEAAPAAPVAPAGLRRWDPAVIERGLAAVAAAAPEAMAELHAKIEKMGKPEVLVEAFQKRLAEHKIDEQNKARAVAQEQERLAAESATARELEQSWDGETATAIDTPPVADEEPPAAPEAATDRGDVSTAMANLLQSAAKLRMNSAALDAEISRRFNTTRYDATADQLNQLAAELLEPAK